MNYDDYKLEAEELEENTCTECEAPTDNEFCSKECYNANQN